MRFSISCLYIILIAFVLAYLIVGEPAQYCRFGHGTAEATVDFCLGITVHYNASSGDNDLYASMQVTRSSALGWTAVGTGSMMAGSLMFIIYGNPFSSEHTAPVVSIRTIDGHHQPHLLSSNDTGAADIQLLHAEWFPLSNRKRDQASMAKVALVCYSCEKWPGTLVSADATAQPWIWAWNAKQEFDSYPDDVHLKMHEHHASSGGWGRFYVDMARSVDRGSTVPSVPPIRPGISALGASDIPGGWSWMDPVVHIHGFLMSAAFMILYPAGVFAMRSGSPKAFKYHSIVQLIASAFLLVGMAIGLIRAHKIDSFHHYIGLTAAVLSIIQITLGWRHHIVFVRIQRRQWASYSHIWLGRGFLLLGWTNVITGLLLTGRGWSLISVAASFISIVALALIGWVWFATRQRKREPQADWEDDDSIYALQATRDDYFAVAADDDDDDADNSRSSSGDVSSGVKVRKEDTE
ncbi:hypothetical protein BJY04DRAFT_229627 [Aspergillus karnatakaensis]|uniref:cytochrome and DOMON domain-containing protein n=1 Tax=Aspergillus karnatakaensis TaxID=1810916 RepID=UPI003CCE48FF